MKELSGEIRLTLMPKVHIIPVAFSSKDQLPPGSRLVLDKTRGSELLDLKASWDEGMLVFNKWTERHWSTEKKRSARERGGFLTLNLKMIKAGLNKSVFTDTGDTIGNFYSIQSGLFSGWLNWIEYIFCELTCPDTTDRSEPAWADSTDQVTPVSPPRAHGVTR